MSATDYFKWSKMTTAHNIIVPKLDRLLIGFNSIDLFGSLKINFYFWKKNDCACFTINKNSMDLLILHICDIIYILGT